jgi:general secretion pathway protein A
MYEDFFGLRERPFNLLSDPRFLFLSKQHAEALTHLQYGLTGRPGVTVLIGEAGTGKTTLVRKALEPTAVQTGRSRIVQISNPTLTRNEFYEYLSAGFGLSADAAVSKTRFLADLERTLMEHVDGSPVAIVVDEAQSLPHELLEEIRLLTNVQTVSGRALTMILVGQPELAERLNEGRLRQLKQRVALRCELHPLSAQETLAYVAKRISVAGGSAEQIFTKAAVDRVHQQSRGIPRVISVICDNALMSAFGAGVRPVNPDIVDEVCRDFHIGQTTTGRVAPVKAPAAPTAAVAAAPPAAAPARQPAAQPPVAQGAGTTLSPRRQGLFAEPVDAAPEPVAEGESAGERGSLFGGFSRKKRFSIF